MLRKILGWLKGKSDAPAPSKEQPSEPLPPSRWLTKDNEDNPFLVDGFDCLAFTQSMLSTTKDQSIALSFVELRASEGREHVGNLPIDAQEIKCHLEYPYEGEVADGVVFKANAMEQKWDIYLYGSHLYFSRSWTGTLAYVATLTAQDGRILIEKIWAEASQAGTNQFAVLQLDYLIKSHLYRRRVPHALPSDLVHDPNVVAFYSFGQYGNMCCFGTWDDTLPWNITKLQPRQEDA